MLHCNARQGQERRKQGRTYVWVRTTANKQTKEWSSWKCGGGEIYGKEKGNSSFLG